jgi:hypothetical protein
VLFVLKEQARKAKKRSQSISVRYCFILPENRKGNWHKDFHLLMKNMKAVILLVIIASELGLHLTNSLLLL